MRALNKTKIRWKKASPERKNLSQLQRDYNKLNNLYQALEKKNIKRKYAIGKLRKEIEQWKETCEILADPSIKKSITKSLKQFAEGKGIKLKDL